MLLQLLLQLPSPRMWSQQVFGEDDVPQEDIIDEEELIMLRELKDLKKDYRDRFGKLKEFKNDIQMITTNINASKE